MLTVTAESHLDHALTADHIRWLLNLHRDRDAFFIATLTLPEHLPSLPCALRGPVVGDLPVLDEDTTMRVRDGRAWPSRMCAFRGRPQSARTSASAVAGRTSRTITIIGGPAAGLPCVLYTAFGGPLAPRELGDPSLPEGERAAAAAFWSEHALAG
jgi:hypothetical protein